ncbi:hypothetical protein A4X13_0g7209 [Tilletia indica]|uniref:H-type lectin domain-containing protein n=1 Tax=Tilletia indica TaxID=43049 RepID=A0A177TG37_9BASI|nr:hypothetical protein A4X13_0g7209 [Tilletia indica]
MTAKEAFLLLSPASSTISANKVQIMAGDMGKEHSALDIAPNLHRALQVARAEQELVQARSIRAEQTTILETKAGLDERSAGEDHQSGQTNDLQQEFEGLHLRAQAIETSHERLIANRKATTCAVHALIFKSLEDGIAQTEKLLSAISRCSSSGRGVNRVQLDNDVSSTDSVEQALGERDQILREVSGARTAYLHLHDRFCSLQKVIETLSRREKDVTDQLAAIQDEITAFLANIDEHLGSIGIERQEKLLEIAQKMLAVTQDEKTDLSRLWLSANEIDTDSKTNGDGAINISKWIIIRTVQLEKLAQALKLTKKAMSLRATASETLDEAEKDALLDGKNEAFLLLGSMNDLEKAVTDCSVGLVNEDVWRHGLDVIDRSADIARTNGNVRDVRDRVWGQLQGNLGTEAFRTLLDSKKLFKLASSPSLGPSQTVAFRNFVLPWDGTSRKEKEFSFPFMPPTSDTCMLTLFKKIDNDWCDPVRIASDYVDNQVADVYTWDTTKIMSFDVSVLGISESDERFQVGSSWFDTSSSWAPNASETEWVSTENITFDRPFCAIPTVRLFMSYLDAGREPVGSLSTTSWAENVTSHGFTLCTKVWNGRTDLFGVTLRWMAHDPNEPTIRSGDLEHISKEWVRDKTGKIRFDSPFPTSAPSVLVLGIAGMDCNYGHKNLRFQIQESNLSSEGFDYVAGCWASSRMKYGRWSWIAIQ